MKRLLTTTLLAGLSLALPASAQWGQLYPDGSIRQRGVILDPPNPLRNLQLQSTPSGLRNSIDLNNGAIYQGGMMRSGPNPLLRQQICLQTGVC